MIVKVIILHGWGQNKEHWRSIAEKLGNNVICLDLPGFGKEKIVNQNWGVPEYTDWVIDKIKGYKQIILIGHSFGGRITTEIASKRPKWLKGIILSGSPSIHRPTLITRLKILIFKLGKFIIPNSLKELLLPYDLKKAVSRNLETTFRKVVVYDQTNQLKNINIPALLIWGNEDKMVPIKIAEEIKHLIKNSELKIIDNAGHNSFLVNPNLFYSYVKKFIENIK